MTDYIAEKENLRVHLSDPSQIDRFLDEGCKIYKVEDGKETLIASPKAETAVEQEE